ICRLQMLCGIISKKLLLGIEKRMNINTIKQKVAELSKKLEGQKIPQLRTFIKKLNATLEHYSKQKVDLTKSMTGEKNLIQILFHYQLIKEAKKILQDKIEKRKKELQK
ncbi:hypothetical protein ACFLYU_05640, partial [Candidatus Dependentiae bacterium]